MAQIEKERAIVAHFAVLEIERIVMYNYICEQGYACSGHNLCDPTKRLQSISYLSSSRGNMTHLQHLQQSFDCVSLGLMKQQLVGSVSCSLLELKAELDISTLVFIITIEANSHPVPDLHEVLQHLLRGVPSGFDITPNIVRCWHSFVDAGGFECHVGSWRITKAMSKLGCLNVE